MTRAPTLTLDELRAMGYTVDGASGKVVRVADGLRNSSVASAQPDALVPALQRQMTEYGDPPSTHRTTGASGAVRSQPANTSAHPARRPSPISAPASDAAPVPAPRRIIAIDPGYDRLAAVCLEAGTPEPTLLDSFSQSSDASDITMRLDTLLARCHGWLCCDPMRTVGVAIMEMPAIHGTYGRNQHTIGPTALAAGMWKLGLATGAVLTLLLVESNKAVYTMTADRTRRDVKQARAGEYLARQGLTRTNDDLRSAAWIGLRYLSTTP